MTKSTREGSSRTCLVPQPDLSDGTPQVSLRLADSSSCLKEMDLTDEISFINSGAFFFRLVLLFCLHIYFLICSVPAPPALSILNMFCCFFSPLKLTMSACCGARQNNMLIPVETTHSNRCLTRPDTCFSLSFKCNFAYI